MRQSMSKKLKIGIIGCGAIGSSLAKVIVKEFKDNAELSALYDIDKDKTVRLARMISRDKAVAAGIRQVIKSSSLVIEAASAASSGDIAEGALKSGRDIMVMSVGGIVNRIKELSALAKKHKAKLYIPSGAICGIDALKAAKGAKISKVTLTTRKNPLAFKGVRYVEALGIKLEDIKEDKVLFSGPAEEAVKYFPQNVNVAAVLSIAGIGAKETRVTIIASPSAKKNIHEIQIESSAGNITARTENILHPENPKTSYLAVLAAVAVLRQMFEPVRVGT